MIRLFRRGIRRGDEGAAMLMVLGVLFVTMLFLLSSLAYALRSMAPTRRDQDAKIALAAAQAGIDEYVSRLTANDNYWEQGNSDTSNAAFSTSGQAIQGTNGAGAKYTYQLLTTASDTAQTGQIKLKVTGSSTAGTGHDKVSRTLTATLRPKGFLSYVYLSDVEVVDPDIIGSSSSCANYYYAGRSSTTGCSNIQWTSGDTVNGPLHSNDALQINGSVNFTNQTTESSWPALNGTSSSTTWWGTQSPPLSGYSPAYAAAISLPVANTTLLRYVAPDVDGDATTPAGPGCYYQGATKITFTGTTMTVLSPGTRNSSTPSRCYNISTPTTAQSGLAIPPVIYVDAGTTTCTTGQIGIPASGESYSSGSSSAISWGSTSSGVTTNYNCQRGSAYVSGTVDGQVNVASKDDIVVTGNLAVQDSDSTDIVGLTAGNCVWVYHPIDSSGDNLYSTPRVDTIEAAILSLRHSFIVQNWNQGNPLATLNVTGAIAQKFRGPVGTGSGTSISTGYYKNYVYDSRLAFLQPPYFLKSDSSPWAVSSLTDG
jgi:Tfp pilus assembly protein PilX